MTKAKIVQIPFTCPDYIERFHCIGSGCEDNCCQGWEIYFDKATYRQYQSIGDARVRETVLGALHPHNDGKNDCFAATLRADGTCPLLTEDKLCLVHATLGSSALCHTCTIYPRNINKIGPVFEESCMVSCPEAARAVLLNPAGITFKKILRPIDMNGRTYTHLTIPSGSMQTGDSIEHHIPSLRDFAIARLQDRTVPVSDRLVMLGIFCSNLHEYVQHGRVREIPILMKFYSDMFSNPETVKGVSQMPTNISFQLQFLREIAASRVNMGGNSAGYAACFDEFTKGIAYTPDAPIEDYLARYINAYDTFYRPFMDEREYILENFLVNHVFRTVFPYAKNGSIIDQYFYLAFLYSLIKMHLIGMAAFNNGLTEGLTARLVYSIARTIEHYPSFIQALLANLKQNGCATLGHMAILIKN